MTPLISAIIGFAVGGLLVGLIMMARSRRLSEEKIRLESKLENLEGQSGTLKETFEALSAQALDKNSERFLKLAEENLKRFQEGAQKDLATRQEKIGEIVKPVQESLEKMDNKIQALEKERKGAYEKMNQYISTMAEDQKRLQSETSSLVQALRSPTSRGQWGEIQLKRVLEMANMVEGVDYQTQVSVEGARPDVVVNLPGGQSIVIDAKVPMDAYLQAMEEDLGSDKHHTLLSQHAKQVRDHLKKLGDKRYTDKFDTPEFVVMFLPDETYFRTALDTDPTLIDFGIDKKVIPASPTTLIALLRAVNYGKRQESLAKNAKEISSLGEELYRRLQTFGGHLEGIGRGLTQAVGKYNSAVGSLERTVLPQARKFKELGAVGKNEEEAEIEQVEKSVRAITSDELDSAQDSENRDNENKAAS